MRKRRWGWGRRRLRRWEGISRRILGLGRRRRRGGVMKEKNNIEVGKEEDK